MINFLIFLLNCVILVQKLTVPSPRIGDKIEKAFDRDDNAACEDQIFLEVNFIHITRYCLSCFLFNFSVDFHF